MNVGDRVRFHDQDCCLSVEAEGVIEALETRPAKYTSADDGDVGITAVTINGVKISHPWGEWADEDFELLVDGARR